MALRVINGAISWNNAVLQISNLADIRKFEKKYVRNIPLPHSVEQIRILGKIALIVGNIYIFHFFLSWSWDWYFHPLAVLISGSAGYLFIKFKAENNDSPTEEIKYGYFICVEKNSGTKEFFGSENKAFIDDLYNNISIVMHDKTATNINFINPEINHFDKIEGSTIYNNSFNEAK